MSLIDRLARQLAPRVVSSKHSHRAAVIEPPMAQVLRELAQPLALVRVDQDVEVGEPVYLPAQPPAPPRLLPTDGRWRSTCRAVSSASGLRCKLLDGHEGVHADERGTFATVYVPGPRAPAKPPRRIDEVATKRSATEVT